MREEFEVSLAKYLDTTERDFRSRGWTAPPFKLTDEHFEWLVDRQIDGLRPVSKESLRCPDSTLARDAFIELIADRARLRLHFRYPAPLESRSSYRCNVRFSAKSFDSPGAVSSPEELSV